MSEHCAGGLTIVRGHSSLPLVPGRAPHWQQLQGESVRDGSARRGKKRGRTARGLCPTLSLATHAAAAAAAAVLCLPLVVENCGARVTRALLKHGRRVISP
jgi:hypothetical protein